MLHEADNPPQPKAHDGAVIVGERTYHFDGEKLTVK